MVLKWTRTKPEPLKNFEQELNLNPNRYLKRFDTLAKSRPCECSFRYILLKAVAKGEPAGPRPFLEML